MGYSTRMNIIEAAEKLFAQKGYSATSVRDIAHAAEISPAMIHYYFHTKEQLLDAISSGLRDSFDEITTIMNGFTGTAFGKMECLVKYYVRKIFESGPVVYILLNEQQVCSTEFSRKLLQYLANKQWSLFLNIIHEGRQKGEFKYDVDVKMLYASIQGTTRYFLFNDKHMIKYRSFPLKQISFRNMQKQVVSHLLQMIDNMLVIKT